jgi:hypothetical protein
MNDNEQNNTLNIKQQNLIRYLLEGMDDTSALLKAGYKGKSRAIICKIKPIFNKLLKEKQDKLIKETISKEECITTLKKIILEDNDNKTKISAILAASKILGFEVIRTENKNDNITYLKFEEDK